MPISQTPIRPDPRWLAAARWPHAPLALAAALLFARVVWLLLCSDLTLAEDEAHYWTWSLHPDWSYTTKPPGVAWLIHLSTTLLGHTEAAVRLPAAVSIAIATLGAAAAARWSFPDHPQLPTIAAVLFACVPAFALASVLMTIDAPLIACWMWGVAFAARALLRGHRGSWLALGVCVALGLLFKHTMLLLPAGVALAAWTTRRDRPALPWRSIAAAIALGALGLLPNLLWNAANDWPTARHLLGHLALPGGDTAPAPHTWNPRHTAEYLALLLPVLGPVLALALLTLRRTTPQTKAHLAFALPILFFYLLVSLRTRTEGNWPIAAACSLTVPAAWCVLEGVRRRHLPTRTLWTLALIAGLLVTTAPAMLGFLSTRRVFGPYIPVARVTGMREHAAAAREQLDRLRVQTGLEPFVLADHYGRASQLMFYQPDTEILSASVPLGGRPSQFDRWPATNPLHPDTAPRLLGRPALLFGRPGAPWSPAFESVTNLRPLPSEPRPDSRTTGVGIGYKGFPERTD
jgi:4-amino-4-deoxy-L-arabinose transferase-like glycosyltransferase